MSTESNDQYRAGFEAWARDIGPWPGVPLDRMRNGEYRHPGIQGDWTVWVAAKSEASTEPSAQSNDGQLIGDPSPVKQDESLDEKAENALLWCYRRMKNSYGRLPFIEEAIAGLRARRAGALSDDATDAARLDWLERTNQTFCGNYSNTGFRAIGSSTWHGTLREDVDGAMIEAAAIEANTKEQPIAIGACNEEEEQNDTTN